MKLSGVADGRRFDDSFVPDRLLEDETSSQSVLFQVAL